MSKKTLVLVVSGLMALSLVMAACAPAATPPSPTTPATPTTPAVSTAPATPAGPAQENPQKEAVKPAPEVPKYGGGLRLPLSVDITTFDSLTPNAGQTPTNPLTNQELRGGDWAKGAAGGYGSSESAWINSGWDDLFDHKTDYIAESTKWAVDDAKNEGTIVYQIRRGVRWAFNPASEASRLVNGRELTTDDVVFALKRVTTDPRAYIYLAQPELRSANITKTGPWEVTVRLPLPALISGIARLGDNHSIYPPEVLAKYGDMTNWRNSVGTGPFMMTDYVGGSQAVLVRNPNFWGKDPVGPGKGNQLPYLDDVRFLIIPDASTRLAAIRTGKVDLIDSLNQEDAAQMRKTTPALVTGPAGIGGMNKIFMRTDKVPFNDVRIRRAMMMATDFKAILQGLYGGQGQISSYPFAYQKEYAALYLNIDDPDAPASVKELYVYNSTRAKQLLKEAGYPNGLKTSIMLLATEVDNFSIIKDMWAKSGIDLTLDVKEAAVYNSLDRTRGYEALSTSGGQGPISIFYMGSSLSGESGANGSMINDPVINDALAKMRRAAIFDLNGAMGMMRELTKYVLDQAYAIPGVKANTYRFWWPWIKNYSGEGSVGYFNTWNWTQWVWLDQVLKKSMGY
ncbi:MAG: ABC transporter substrate-binding protein [Chloroflexota bacterium]